MILFKLKSDVQMTPDLILSLSLVKWLLTWLAVKVIVKKNHPKTLLLSYIILATNHTTIHHTAIHHTCNGIVSLCRHNLAAIYKYVLFGQFSTDPLQKESGKLRRGSSGTYFINVQQCIEKLHIKQTSLLLNQNVNIHESMLIQVTNVHLVIINFVMKVQKYMTMWKI